MTTGNKVATVIFWVAATGLAGVFAWYNVRPAVARSDPWLFYAALFMCGVAFFGVRECVRTLQGASVSRSGLSTIAFWLGVAYFGLVAALVAWVALR